MIAHTPKGREVRVVVIPIGTANEHGQVFFEGIAISGYTLVGSRPNSLEEALSCADERIDKMGLQAE